jgi:hypothetical protein
MPRPPMLWRYQRSATATERKPLLGDRGRGATKNFWHERRWCIDTNFCMKPVDRRAFSAVVYSIKPPTDCKLEANLDARREAFDRRGKCRLQLVTAAIEGAHFARGRENTCTRYPNECASSSGRHSIKATFCHLTNLKNGSDEFPFCHSI